jgi:hypothetical protein
MPLRSSGSFPWMMQIVLWIHLVAIASSGQSNVSQSKSVDVDTSVGRIVVDISDSGEAKFDHSWQS